jgi:hypothetical protein
MGNEDHYWLAALTRQTSLRCPGLALSCAPGFCG